MISYLCEICKNSSSILQKLRANAPANQKGDIPGYIKMFIIDFAADDFGLNENSGVSKKEKDKAVRNLMISMSMGILDDMADWLEDAEILVNYLFQSFNTDNYLKKNNDSFFRSLKQIRRQYFWKEIKQISNPLDKLDHYMVSIEKLRDPDHILFCGLVPLWYLANNHKVNGQLGSIVLCIDNIDPLPPNLQVEIAEKFRFLHGSDSWRKQYPKNCLSIILPVRISTYRRRIRQLQGSNLSIPFLSLYPSDVLIYRLSYFFVTKGEGTSLSKLPTQHMQNAVVLYLYALWSHLIDEDGYFRTMIDSLCGTNINNANILAHNWLLCPSLKYIPLENSDAIENFYNDFKLIAAQSLLRDFWSSICQALGYSLAVYLDQFSFVGNSKTVGEKASIAFAELIGAILRDQRIICYPNDKRTIGTRRRLAWKLRPFFIKTIENQLNGTTQGAVTVFKNHVSQIASIFSSAVKHDQLKYSNLIHFFINYFTSSIDYCFQKECVANENFDAAMAKVLGRYVIQVIERAKEMNPTDFVDRQYQEIVDEVNPYVGRAKLHAPKVSRFFAGLYLLEPRLTTYTHKLSPQNVFVVGGNKFRPVALHILYVLNCASGHEISLGSLYDVLEYYHYDEQKEINPTIRSMVDLDRRLMYFDVTDYRRLSNIESDRTRLLWLSSTGRAYFENLLVSPPYLAWCLLSRNSKIAIDSKVDKIRTELGQLRSLIDWELSIVRDNKRDLIEDNCYVDEYLCASFDVLIRSLKYYIPSIISLYIRRKKPAYVDILNELYDYCIKTIIRTKSIFSDSRVGASGLAYDHDKIVSWEEQIGWITRKVHKDINVNLGDK